MKEKEIGTIKIHSEKFKTTVTAVMFRMKLKKQTATKNALLLKYLSSGSVKYPDICAMERKCMDMYGSIFSADIIKKGGEQILLFYMETPGISWEKNALIKEGMEFLSDIITNPVLEDGLFDENRLERAKKALKADILSAKENKRYYAYKSFTEKMLTGESSGIPGDGYAEDIDSITAEEMMMHYKIVLERAPLAVIFAGDLGGVPVKRYVKLLNLPKNNRVASDVQESHRFSGEKNFSESEDLSQNRLCLGFSSSAERNGINMAAGKVFSEILGGAGSSRLYKSVREKEGLAYYVSSSFSPFTMCVSVETGIGSDKDKCVEIIKREIENIKKKGFSRREIGQAKKEILKGLSALSDSKQALMDYVLEGMVLGKNLDISKEINDVKALGAQNVQRFAAGLDLDTVYFLGREKEA